MKQYNLTGSEKQIAWATDILNSGWGTIERNIARCAESAEKWPTEAAMFDADAALWNEIRAAYGEATKNITTAREVIDRRKQLDGDAVVNAFNVMTMQRQAR